jgi:hypothetical protein
VEGQDLAEAPESDAIKQEAEETILGNQVTISIFWRQSRAAFAKIFFDAFIGNIVRQKCAKI